jgi:hypothetical protein
MASDQWEDLSPEQRSAWLRGMKLYEVLDSYGIPVFTGTLNEGGSIDADRFTLQDDGSFIVKMYEGPGGIGGEMIVRPKEGS